MHIFSFILLLHDTRVAPRVTKYTCTCSVSRPFEKAKKVCYQTRLWKAPLCYQNRFAELLSSQWRLRGWRCTNFSKEYRLSPHSNDESSAMPQEVAHFSTTQLVCSTVADDMIQGALLEHLCLCEEPLLSQFQRSLHHVSIVMQCALIFPLNVKQCTCTHEHTHEHMHKRGLTLSLLIKSWLQLRPNVATTLTKRTTDMKCTIILLYGISKRTLQVSNIEHGFLYLDSNLKKNSLLS